MKDIFKVASYICIFAVPFVVLIVSSDMFFPYITGKNFTFRILVEILLASWLILMLYDASYRPKFSWLAATGLGLILVMFFANLFGEYAPKSFWSNFERMEGYVTLVHFYIYFLALGTFLTTQKLWRRFFNTTLAVAVLLSFYGFAQISGSAEISQGGWRIDGTLGNSTYMAVYMLFHIFIATLMLTYAKSKEGRFLYGFLILLFTFLLLQTGTRGAALGLIGGGIASTIYIAIFAGAMPRLRKTAIGVLGALVLLIGSFIAARDTALVQSIPVLDRLASISLESGEVRFMVWGTAIEGIKERPLLGWGQGNFNYVFNQYYTPELYRAEAWYDRVHNVVLDWTIAGGILGALAYFSIFGACFYYLILKPWVQSRRKEVRQEQALPVLESSLLVGILTAYLIHNMFVFDNVVSYIFFAVVLAFIHSHVSNPIEKLEKFRVDRQIVEKVVAPVTVVLLAFVIYFVNIPGMQTAGDIIDAMRASSYDERFEEFESALDRDSFADQEIVEQMTQSAVELASRSEASGELKDKYTALAEKRMREMMEEKPGDARFYVFLAGMYRAENDLDKARKTLATARELSPKKVDVILEQGVIEMIAGDYEKMQEYFSKAHELAPGYSRVQWLYASGLMLTDQTDKLTEVFDTRNILSITNSQIFNMALNESRKMNDLNQILQDFIEDHPESYRAKVSYALFAYKLGDEETAIEKLEEYASSSPAFGKLSNCYIKNIEDEKDMIEGCGVPAS